MALEKAKEEKKAHGKIETHHPAYLGAQETYYVGNIKGVGHSYQKPFIGTYAKVAFTKLLTIRMQSQPFVLVQWHKNQLLPFWLPNHCIDKTFLMDLSLDRFATLSSLVLIERMVDHDTYRVLSSNLIFRGEIFCVWTSHLIRCPCLFE